MTPSKLAVDKARSIIWQLINTEPMPKPQEGTMIIAQALDSHAEQVAGKLVEALELYALQCSAIAVGPSIAKHTLEQYRKGEV